MVIIDVPMSPNGTTSTHKTTEMAIEILDLVAESNGITLSEIMSELGLTKSTAYTHVNTLQKHGFVVREGGKYWIGLRFRKYSMRARVRKPSYQIVNKYVRELADSTDQEVEFLVEENGRANIVYHSEPLTDDPVYLYLHNTAAGKAILAEFSHQQVTNVLDQWGLPRATANTTTDREALFQELNSIRERDYSYNDGECFEGYHGVGAAINGIDDEVLGALTVGGPVYRVSKRTLENEYVDILHQTIDAIEEEIESQRQAIASELVDSA